VFRLLGHPYVTPAATLMVIRSTLLSIRPTLLSIRPTLMSIHLTQPSGSF